MMLINTPDPTPYQLMQHWFAYLYGNHLYYHAAGDHESPITDAEWDSTVEFLQRWRHLLPAHARTRMDGDDVKAAAHGVAITSIEQLAAYKWETLGGRFPPPELLPNASSWLYGTGGFVDNLDD